jgi:hypothetical protein
VIKLECLEVRCGPTRAKVLTSRPLTFVVTNFQMESPPPLDIRYYDVEDYSYFLPAEGDSGGVVALSDGVDQDVKQLTRGRTSRKVFFRSSKVGWLAEMKDIPETGGT